MPPVIYNTIGTLGVGLILTTYFLLQTERLRSDQLLYSILNLAGASFILFSLIFDFNLPSFFVETAWVAISLLGIWRNWKQPALSK
jgi:hypothetical protein